jgi:hypothetical protein
MARPPDSTFPRTRHLALDLGDGAGGAEAVVEFATSLAPGGAGFAGDGPEPEAKGSIVPQPADTPEGALGQAAPLSPLAAGAPAAAPQEGAPAPSQPQAPALPRVAVVAFSTPAAADEMCAALDGSAADVRCPSSLEGRKTAGDEAAAAARTGDAVMLDRLDRWYRMGPEAAGFCRSCELALVEALRESYGDHVQTFDVLEQMRLSPGPLRDRPFARQREALRLAETVEAAKRACLRARDEARRERGVELSVLGRAGPIGAASLLACRHLDGLVFDVPANDPLEALLPLLAARAALGQRPAVGVLPRDVTAAQVRQFAAMATACDTDIALEPGAGREACEALAQHRRFFGEVRERYPPVAPLADVEILLSPACDHWTGGAHQAAANEAAVAAARAQLQITVRLTLAGGVQSQLLVVAGASALPPQDAAAARRHLEGGGDLLLAGRCVTVDEEGRPGDDVFREADAGEIERVGEGRLYYAPDPAGIAKGLRELVGRGRAQVVLAGRGRLFARAYLDPERKLDVHLVNLDPQLPPAQGVQLTIAGQAAGGGRAGYWFAPERAGGKDGERIPLNPSGFSVSTILPSVSAYALLAVPR